jgi:Uncharacterized protein conserved in bacteria (DUF2188)
VGWLFHVIEREDGRWVCQHGQVIDDHATMDEAVDHCREMAAAHRPATVIVHRAGEPAERIELP